MKKLIAGTRGSRLAVTQTEMALEKLGGVFPSLAFEMRVFSTPGDRDLTMDLTSAPEDFFTRDLDEALRTEEIDLAIHSAKDLPESLPAEIDWFWLPWHEDAEDVWVLPPGKLMTELPCDPVVGVSSARRENYCRKRFPQARLKPVRGAIPDRLAQLDKGEYDALLVAGAALTRLGLEDRVSERVPRDKLPTPEAQGRLAVTFRTGDPVISEIRACFVKAVRFVGAGVGSADNCTWGGVNDLRQADVCLYDVLMDEALLKFAPAHALKIFVGKRCGAHCVQQCEITRLITRYARQGKRVVRLKGGDPGVFGRLTEEIDELRKLSIPYHVRPGVSAVTVATTGTGILLTQRGISRGFTVMTPRAADGSIPGIALETRARLPLMLFMAVNVARDMADQLLAEGWEKETPVAVIFNAGAEDEEICSGTLVGLRSGAVRLKHTKAPGVLIIGGVAKQLFSNAAGPLCGKRVLLTCSGELQDKAAQRVRDFGGTPLACPMIKLMPEPEACAPVARVGEYDWVAITSPSAVRIFMEAVGEADIDRRKIPRIMSCGAGCAGVFKEYGLVPDLTPESDFSAKGLALALSSAKLQDQRVLRLRSQRAGTLLTESLREHGALVDDVILYRNTPIKYARLPPFDMVFFASASAVEALMEQGAPDILRDKTVVALGQPTRERLLAHGHTPDIIPAVATVNGAIEALACSCADPENSRRRVLR